MAQVSGDWRQFRAALVNQEHIQTITGGHKNHVVSAFDRRQRRNKSRNGETQSAGNCVIRHKCTVRPDYSDPNPPYNTPVDSRLTLFGYTQSDWAHVLPTAETGCLLLAPSSEEGWWRHSVVLVLNHDAGGSTGVILNRPTNALLHRVVSEIDYAEAHHKVLADRRVSMGGPMGTEKGSRCLVALSRVPLEGATSEVFPGLWHVSDFAAVSPEHEKHLSVFVGYCGWVTGQLDREVEAGAWLVAAASASNTLGLVSTAPRGDLMGSNAWESMRTRLGETPERDMQK